MLHLLTPSFPTQPSSDRPTIFASAHGRMPHRRHMDAQLVCAPSQRLEFDPGGAIARAFDHAVARFGGLAVFLVDMHLLAATARLLGDRKSNRLNSSH